MSCEICGRVACSAWMHSSRDQERYEERQKMSDNIHELRCDLQEANDQITDLEAYVSKLESQLSDAEHQRDELAKAWKTCVPSPSPSSSASTQRRATKPNKNKEKTM